jgi:hypothetical protein
VYFWSSANNCSTSYTGDLNFIKQEGSLQVKEDVLLAILQLIRFPCDGVPAPYKLTQCCLSSEVDHTV